MSVRIVNGRLRVRNGMAAVVGMPTAVATAVEIAIGLIGQSNMWRLWAAEVNYVLSDPLGQEWDGSSFGYVGCCDPTRANAPGTGYTAVTPNWSSNAGPVQQKHPSGDGMAQFVNQFTKALPIPMYNFLSAVPSTTIETWMSGANGNHWDPYAAAVQASGKVVRFSGWLNGEENSAQGTSKSSYKTSLRALHDQALSLAGLTRATADQMYFGIALLGPGTTYAPEGNMGVIRQAQLEYIAENTGAYLMSIATDMDLGGDGIHFQPAGQIRMGARYAALAVAWLKGQASKWIGPRIPTNGLTVNGTTATVSTTGATGALKDGAGGNGSALQGFRFYDAGGALLTINSCMISGTQIVFQLSGIAVNMDYAMANAPFGGSTALASVVYDSATIPGDTTGWPLIPCARVSVTLSGS
jgi:hypothetical protein